MNLLIVGGVAGGASAAARARRLSEEAHIVLFERGPDVSFANCGLPYYVGVESVLETPTADRPFLLDVRTPQEFDSGHIPGAVNIPVDDLRSRLCELPRDRKIAAYCQVGQRGYLATRILLQAGFSAANVGGGYKTYKLFQPFA